MRSDVFKLVFIKHTKIHRKVTELFFRHILNFKVKYIPLTLVTLFDSMIISFGDKDTKKIWEAERIKKLSTDLQEIARRKLRMLNNSQNIADLLIPPSNRLEKLRGNLKDFYSIRINSQWRIIFKWNGGNASEVEIIDYH